MLALWLDRHCKNAAIEIAVRILGMDLVVAVVVAFETRKTITIQNAEIKHFWFYVAVMNC